MTEQVVFAELFSIEARRAAVNARYQFVRNETLTTTGQSMGPVMLLRAPYVAPSGQSTDNWCCPVGIMLRHDRIDEYAGSPTFAYAAAVLERAKRISYHDDADRASRVRQGLREFMERFDGGHYIPERDLPRLLGVPRDA